MEILEPKSFDKTFKNVKNLSVAWRSQAPALLVTMSPMSCRQELLQKAGSSTNQKPRKYELGTAKQS